LIEEECGDPGMAVLTSGFFRSCADKVGSTSAIRARGWLMLLQVSRATDAPSFDSKKRTKKKGGHDGHQRIPPSIEKKIDPGKNR
jgi:hypothetical protein